MRENAIKPFAIIDSVFLASTVIEAESLLVEIPEQVKWFDTNVGAFDAALQETPVVLHPISVHCALCVTNGMVNDLVA